MIEDTPIAINSKSDLICACLKNLEASKAHDIVGIDLKEPVRARYRLEDLYRCMAAGLNEDLE